MKILKNILRNIYVYIILLIIFSLTLVFSSFMYKNISSVNKYNRFINSYFNIPNVYYVMGTHTMEDHQYVTKLDKKYEDGGTYFFLSQLFDEADKIGINNFGITRHGHYSATAVLIREVKDNEAFNHVLPGQKPWVDYPNTAVFLNELFGENIKFPLMKGRNFSLEDFKQEEYLSVIAGYEFSKKFKVGDILNVEVQKWQPHPEDNVIPVKIIGFLEKDTEVLAYVSPEIIKGDNILIIGVSNEFKTETGYFRVFKETISGTVETTNPKEVEEKVLELARTMGYEGKGGLITLYDMNEAFQDNIQFNDRSFSTYYIILGTSIIASILIIALVIYLVIRKNKYLYGVLLINGGTKNNIRNNILIEMIVLVAFADSLALILSIKYFSYVNLLVFLLYNLLILAITYITATLILKNKKMIEFINFTDINYMS